MMRLSWPARGLLLALIATVIFVTFFRDEVFVSLNWYLWFLYDRDYQFDATAEYHGDPEWLPLWAAFTYNQLTWGKWVLTFAFIGLNFVLTASVVQVIYRNRAYFWYTLYFFATIISLGGLCYATGFVIGAQPTMFEVSRVFIHMAQGPLPIMLLVPAYLVLSSSVTKSQG